MAESKSEKSKSEKRRSGGSSRSKERQESGGSSNSKDKQESGSSSRSNNSSKGPTTREIAAGAVEQVHDLIGRPVESITGVARDGDEWTVTLEVLELERVPTTTDVLGKYEVTMDKNGELIGAQRTRRYPRAEAGEV
jgi:hypothetical protein